MTSPLAANHTDIRVSLHRGRTEPNLWVEAARVHRELAAQRPDSAELLYWVGVCEQNAGWLVTARNTFMRLQELAPNDTRAAGHIQTIARELKQRDLKSTKSSEVKRLKQEAAEEKARAKSRTSEVFKLKGAYRTLRGLPSELAANGVAGVDWSRSLLAMHKTEPSLAISIAQLLADKAETADAGTKALVRLHSHRNLHDFVSQLLDKLDPAERVESCFREAAKAYLHSGEQSAARELVSAWCSRRQPPASASMDPTGVAAALEVALVTRDQDLTSRVLDIIATTDLAQTASEPLLSMIKRGRGWLADRQALAAVDVPAIGVFSYRSPTKPSSNVGDYVQTIAALGLLAKVPRRI